MWEGSADLDTSPAPRRAPAVCSGPHPQASDRAEHRSADPAAGQATRSADPAVPPADRPHEEEDRRRTDRHVVPVQRLAWRSNPYPSLVVHSDAGLSDDRVVTRQIWRYLVDLARTSGRKICSKIFLCILYCLYCGSKVGRVLWRLVKFFQRISCEP